MRFVDAVTLNLASKRRCGGGGAGCRVLMPAAQQAQLSVTAWLVLRSGRHIWIISTPSTKFSRQRCERQSICTHILWHLKAPALHP